MKHSKFSYVLSVVESGMPVLLEGPAGSGKSTLAMQIAEELSLTFHAVSCTKQMSVNALLGFISINGVYIRTQFREAFEHGGLFLLDEIDAADPNVLLTLNTIENGFISFPDGIVKAHPSFRLIATANPSDAHSTYTGRSKLDFSTLDRYFIIPLERDPDLELSLTSSEVVQHADIARDILASHGITSTVTMRDTIRLHKLSQLGVSDCVYHDVVFHKHQDLYNEFNAVLTIKKNTEAKQFMKQSDAATVDELWEVIQREAQSKVTEYDAKERAYALSLINSYYSGKPVPPLPPGYSITKQPTKFSYEYMVTTPSGTVYTFDERETDIIPF